MQVIPISLTKGKPRRSGVSFGHNRRNYARNQQTLTIILNFQLLLLTISPTQAVLSRRTTRSKK